MDWKDYFTELGLVGVVSIAAAVVLAVIFLLSKQFSLLIATDPKRGAYLAEAFPAIIDDGLVFLVAGGLCLVGIGSSSQIADEDAPTLCLLGWHVVASFISFYFARLLSSGYVFYMLAFIGVVCRFTIVGIISLHFTKTKPSLKYWATPVALVFTFLLLCLHRLTCLRRYLKRFEVHFVCSCPSHNKTFQSVVTVGFQLTSFGLGLLGVGTWMNLAKKYPHLQTYLASYYGVAFWAFYGAQILGKGIVYEILVWLGVVAEIAMFLTSALYVLEPLPGYKLVVLPISFLAATLVLEWCRLSWYLDLCFPSRE